MSGFGGSSVSPRHVRNLGSCYPQRKGSSASTSMTVNVLAIRKVCGCWVGLPHQGGRSDLNPQPCQAGECALLGACVLIRTRLGPDFDLARAAVPCPGGWAAVVNRAITPFKGQRSDPRPIIPAVMSADDVLCKGLAAFRMSIVPLFVLFLLWIPSPPGSRFAAADRDGARRVPPRPQPYFDAESEHLTLDWSRCRITDISAGMFDQWPDLTKLDLQGNRIETIEADAFLGLDDLVDLDLQQNFISTIEAGAFRGLSGLGDLDLKRNRISTIQDGAFGDLDHLDQLDLSYNRLVSIGQRTFQGLQSLCDALELYNNRIEHIAESAFESMPDLLHLWLANNEIKSIDRGMFAGLTSLDVLSLRNNHITVIQEGAFVDNGKLIELYLDNNGLVSIKNGMFNGMPELTLLDLSSNRIAAIEYGAFADLGSLSELYASSASSIRHISFRSYAGIANDVYRRLDCNDICNWITPTDPIGQLKRHWGIPDTATITCSTGPARLQ